MKYVFSLLILSFFCPLYAQFEGGDADGFGMENIYQSNFIYNGNDKDGSHCIALDLNNQYYRGGDKDGNTCIALDLTNQFYAGGENDGYTFTEVNDISFFYRGADEDGFTEVYILGNSILYSGGQNDGFTFSNVYQKFIWTGAIGTGWNVAGNWSTNSIPTLRHDVIIPENVPNYPAVNAGTLSIGKNPFDAEYLCNNLLIDSNAFMTTRVNCFITLYGKMVIRGNLLVKNPSNQAFIAMSSGDFKIKSGGLVVLKEN